MACSQVQVELQDEPSGASCVQTSCGQKDFDFVDRPPQDFFCPVSFELLLEPQLTSCCGHHLSIEAATRLQREGKACPIFTFTQYSKMKCSDCIVESDPFYSHHNGYKFKVKILYFDSSLNAIGAYLYLMKGEYDDQLNWPVEVKVQLELLNQNGDHHHVVRTKNMKWNKDKRDTLYIIDVYLMKYSDLEKSSDGVQYMMNDCLKFRVHITILPIV